MSKSDFIEEFGPVSSRGYSDSQSPQAHRGSAQDFEQFSKGDVQDSAKYGQRVSPENASGSKVDSDLGIESVNERAFPARRK
jgi:hypothetical protein